jgi:hypothetical protein
MEWWSGGVVESLACRYRSALVPKGLNEGSQAIYCLVCALSEIRPVGTVCRGGMSFVYLLSPTCRRSISSVQSRPFLRRQACFRRW